MNKLNRRSILRGSLVALGGAAQVQSLAQTPRPAAGTSADCHCSLGTDGSSLDTGTSEILPALNRYDVELRDLNRVFALPGSPTRHSRLAQFYKQQLAWLESVNFDGMSQSGKVDYLLFRERLLREQAQLEREAQLDSEIEAVVPFQQIIINLEEGRRRMETVEPRGVAENLAKLSAAIEKAKTDGAPKVSPAILERAATRLLQQRATLRTWFNFYALYDPKFAWWADGEYKKADEAIEAHAQLLHKASGGTGTLEAPAAAAGGGRGGGARGGRGGGGGGTARSARSTGAIGSNEELSGIGPVGNEVLVDELQAAMIPYSPADLIALANREFAWCDREMLRASGELGFGTDWKKAVESIKNKYVEPGQMIYLVRDLSREAVEYLEKNKLVSLPPLLKEDYWEEAMTPQMQLVNPFFTGGATIQVSSPASSQTLQQRMEALRGNNIFFARATVFHELIPGHHMQQYMTQRYRTYRSIFSTPFWTEGMAFYWEMLLWDLGFTHTPEQRIGALVWRMHRCARIIFSLSFHLSKMTAIECVQFLMDRVGFDRANAEGEVRRSFAGSYAPIYQCAYMLGALQFYALHKELVGSGKMTNMAFHDALYREGNMPVEMVRLAVSGQKVTRDYKTSWKFYGPLA